MSDKTAEQPQDDGIRKDAEAAKSQAAAENGVPDKPMLGIDPAGNMTLFIPMTKTNEIFARGMIDMARSSLLKWYVEYAQKQREFAHLAAKTGFQRLKDKILAR